MLTFVLLKGWGFTAEVMMPLRDALKRHFPDANYITPADNCSSIQHDDQLQEWRNTWLPDKARTTPNSHICYLGWSLGGLIASRLAALPDAHTAALVTLATNRCFTADEQWPCAMPRADFDSFFQAWQRRPEDTLRHFTRMALQGCSDPRSLRTAAAKCVDTALAVKVGQQELEWLRDSDLSGYWIKKQYLCRHFFAAHDALVPHAAAKALLASGTSVEVFPDAGHLLPLTHALPIAADCARLLQGRLDA